MNNNTVFDFPNTCEGYLKLSSWMWSAILALSPGSHYHGRKVGGEICRGDEKRGCEREPGTY